MMKLMAMAVAVLSTAAGLADGARLDISGEPTREETLEWFRHEMYGRAPIGRPSDEKIGTDTVSFGRFTIHVHCSLPKGADRDHPAPVFLFGDHFNAANSKTRTWEYPGIPTNSITARGYAYVRINFNDVAPNTYCRPGQGGSWSNGVHSAYGVGKGDDWGTLSAWAWAFSRTMDWIETRPELNAREVAVLGISRGGKTALWAAAQDTRFAMGISACSGTGGARLLGLEIPEAEHIKDMMDGAIYFWFCPNFRKYIGKEPSMPHDADDLLGLISPRLAYVSSGSQDDWAGPRGEFEAARRASRHWEKFGKTGLALKSFGPPGTVSHEGSIGYHLHDGPHELNAYDWARYMDFADRHFHPVRVQREVPKTGLTACQTATAVREPSPRAFGPMRVALTFDDSLKDHLLIAAPELEKRSWRGVFNIITDKVGTGEKCLTWDDVRELVRRGHEVTTHTTHHHAMVDLLKKSGEAAVRAELAESRDLIAEKTGCTPRYYCAPGVQQNAETARIARSEGLEQMSVPRRNFGIDEEGKTRAVLGKFIRSGFVRLDVLHHGVSAADHGGWRSYSTRAAFAKHLDEIAALEREGRIVVTDYDGMASDCRLGASAWPRHGVLSLSFDDRNMDSWTEALPLLARYRAKATFCICGKIDAPALAFARRATDEGHEIALHGVAHRNADDAVKSMGADAYWRAEVEPQVKGLAAGGLVAHSFAYPNCRRSPESDAVLFAHGFTRVRGYGDGVPSPNPHDPEGKKLDKWKPVATCDAEFAPAADFLRTPRIRGIIMGENYHTDLSDILAAMRRAGERAETFAVISHAIALEAKGINMKTEWLERMLHEADGAGLVVRGLR